MNVESVLEDECVQEALLRVSLDEKCVRDGWEILLEQGSGDAENAKTILIRDLWHTAILDDDEFNKLMLELDHDRRLIARSCLHAFLKSAAQLNVSAPVDLKVSYDETRELVLGNMRRTISNKERHE